MFINKHILTAASLAVLACGIASADTVAYNGTVTYPGAQSLPAATDFTYSISLPDFNSSLGTLTGVEIIFYATETVTSLNLVNSGTNTSSNFTATIDSLVTQNFSNSANSADVFHGTGGAAISFAPYETPTITLGGSSNTGTCPTGTPSASCNNVTYNLNVEDDVVKEGYTTVTGLNGLTGVAKAGTSISDYVGSGNFTIGGNTSGSYTIGGGGSASASIASTGAVAAEVDYTYTPVSATPEPTTMVLFGSALVGLGLIRKRARS